MLSENWPVANRENRKKTGIFSPFLFFAHVIEYASASLLSPGLQLQRSSWPFPVPPMQSQPFSSSCTDCTDSLGSKTFYDCKQIICVWLDSTLAALGLEIKSGSPKWHSEDGPEGQTDGFAITSVISWDKKLGGKAFRETPQLLWGMSIESIFSKAIIYNVIQTGDTTLMVTTGMATRRTNSRTKTEEITVVHVLVGLRIKHCFLFIIWM